MEDIKLLISLAKKGAVGDKVRITLRELSKEIGVSPQTVLRKLDNMEKMGYIKREVSGKKTFVEISPDGLKLLEDIFDEIGKILYGKYILGEVVSGVGEGYSLLAAIPLRNRISALVAPDSVIRFSERSRHFIHRLILPYRLHPRHGGFPVPS